MKYLLIICFLLTGCVSVKLKDNHLLIQDKSKEFSCFAPGINYNSYIANCCWPFREKIMLCLYENSTSIDNYSASIVLKVVPENTGK